MTDQICVLTCQNCDMPNPRELPYSLVKPDSCEHCRHPFRTRLDIAKMDFRLWRRQSKLASAIEAVVNTFTGLLIAFLAMELIVRAYNIPVTPYENLIIVGWMTVISIIRQYVIRRIWNSEFWKYKRPGRSI